MLCNGYRHMIPSIRGLAEAEKPGSCLCPGIPLSTSPVAADILD